MKVDYALLTDLYQLTMAQGYWDAGKVGEQACFNMYFRDYPFKGGYAVACGMAQLADLVEQYRFSDEDVAYLASLDAPGGGPLFNPDFLEYLRDLRQTVDIDAVLEGTIVFPHEPIGLEMRERGERLAGIRIDSGDLSWLSKTARQMLDAAGLEDCGIVLSNDLDEFTIDSILGEGADVMSFGVGTKLASAYDQPTLGGVYKLAAVRPDKDAPWTSRLKISESVAKLTTPGVLDVRRYYLDNGIIAGDMVFDVTRPVDDRQIIVDPLDDLRQKRLAGKRFETLLAPLARGGQVALSREERSAMSARERALAGLETLDESQLRMLNPHTYPVGLELGLNERRRALVAELRHIV